MCIFSSGICTFRAYRNVEAGSKGFRRQIDPQRNGNCDFVNGKYPPGDDDHKHAAFYLEQDDSYIYVMDQWTGKASNVSARRISRKGGMRSDGSYPDASNNAEAFYVIE